MFSLEGRKVIGSASTMLHDWPKRLVPLFHLIRSKTKTNNDFMYTVINWFTEVYVSFVIDYSDYLALVLWHSVGNGSFLTMDTVKTLRCTKMFSIWIKMKHWKVTCKIFICTALVSQCCKVPWNSATQSALQYSHLVITSTFFSWQNICAFSYEKTMAMWPPH